MFTGIIADIGAVKVIKEHELSKGGASKDFLIETCFDMTQVTIGASICCSGVCLTVIEKGENWFKVNASLETLTKTNLKLWQKDTKVNLERSLKVGDELGGHFVFGHVDSIARIVSIEESSNSHILEISCTPEYRDFIAEKGSITLDGVSLTINAVKDSSFSVNIIPHTWENTTFKNVQTGDTLNMEIDMLARYVANLCKRS